MIDMTRRTFLGAAVLIAAMPALAAAEGTGVRIRLQAFLDRTGEARGRFFQSVTDKTGREAAQPSEGIFRFRRPGRFEWTYEKPYRQQIMSDGETLWIYDPDLMQVTVRRLDGAVGSTPAGILFGSSDFEKEWVLTERSEFELEARPKSEGSSFERVVIGFSREGELESMQLVDAFGQTTALRFSDIVREPISAETFDFQVPEGVDVVRDSAAD